MRTSVGTRERKREEANCCQCSFTGCTKNIVESQKVYHLTEIGTVCTDATYHSDSDLSCDHKFNLNLKTSINSIYGFVPCLVRPLLETLITLNCLQPSNRFCATKATSLH